MTGKTERRSYIKYAGAGVVIIAVAGARYYLYRQQTTRSPMTSTIRTAPSTYRPSTPTTTVRTPQSTYSPTLKSTTSEEDQVTLVIDHGDVDRNLTDFPVLIHLSRSSGINGKDVRFIFDELGSNSKKIAVTTSDKKTKCYVEVEKWDSKSKEAWLWVRVPSVSSSTDTILYLYYDSNNADNASYIGDIGSTPGGNVWDGNFKAVYHMRDATTSTIKDSTSNSFDGTKHSSNMPVETLDAKICVAQDFEKDNDAWIDMGYVDLPSKLTVEAWIKAESISAWCRVLSKRDGNANNYEFLVDDSNRIYFAFKVSGKTKDSPHYSISTGTWYYVVGTYDNEYIKLYIDGVEQSWPGTSQTSNPEQNNLPLCLGARSDDHASRWDGVIDEIRISDKARDTAWIKASYESMLDHLITYSRV